MMEAYPHMNKDFGGKEKRWKNNLKVIRNDSNLIMNLKMMKTFMIILIKKEKNILINKNNNVKLKKA